MRQVMPHRNNIGVDIDSCKSFLRPICPRPVDSHTCGAFASVGSGALDVNYFNKNNGL
jgi:hypothetical protein